MNVLLRILGLNLLAHVGSRLPSRTARTTTSVVLIAANLLPIGAVLSGAAGLGDVFVIYWFENVVVWFTTAVKIVTARGPNESTARNAQLFGDVMVGNVIVAAFFTFHFGLFTFVHGVFSFTLARATGGFSGDSRTWSILLVAITGQPSGLPWHQLVRSRRAGPRSPPGER